MTAYKKGLWQKQEKLPQPLFSAPLSAQICRKNFPTNPRNPLYKSIWLW